MQSDLRGVVNRWLLCACCQLLINGYTAAAQVCVLFNSIQRHVSTRRLLASIARHMAL